MPTLTLCATVMKERKGSKKGRPQCLSPSVPFGMLRLAALSIALVLAPVSGSEEGAGVATGDAADAARDDVSLWFEPDNDPAALVEHFCRGDGMQPSYVLGNIYFRFLGPAFIYGKIDPRNEEMDATSHDAARNLREAMDSYATLDLYTESECRNVVKLVVSGLSAVSVYRRLRDFRGCIGRQLLSLARLGKEGPRAAGDAEAGRHEKLSSVYSAAAESLGGSLWNATWPPGSVAKTSWWWGSRATAWGKLGREVLLASEMLASDLALRGAGYNTSVACRELMSDGGVVTLLQDLLLRRSLGGGQAGPGRKRSCQVAEWWWCEGATSREAEVWAGGTDDPVNTSLIRSVVMTRHDAIAGMLEERARKHVTDAYIWLLGRPPDPGGMAAYYDLLRRKGGGYADVREQLRQSAEYMRRCEGGMCERADRVVRGLFVELLFREPDLEALDAFGNEVCVCVLGNRRAARAR